MDVTRARRTARPAIAVATIAVVAAVVLLSQPTLVASAAVAGQPDARSLTTVDVAEVTDGGGATFTLADLADGSLDVATFVAFWDGEIVRIRARPCAATPAAESMVVTATVGATPPPEHVDRYPDYTPLVAQALSDHASTCALG